MVQTTLKDFRKHKAFKELNTQLGWYNPISPRPPIALQRKAMREIDKLLAEHHLHKFRRFEHKMGRYIGNKRTLKVRLLDSWINRWDVRKVVLDVRGIGRKRKRK